MLGGERGVEGAEWDEGLWGVVGGEGGKRKFSFSWK